MYKRSDKSWNTYLAISRAKRNQIARAKQKYWRESVYNTANSAEGIWKLARWACTKSHLPPEPPKMPDIYWQGSRQTTTQGKADILGERFYPETEADLDNILDQECQYAYNSPLFADQSVTEEDVQAIIRKTKPDKYPGNNEIPNRFLQAIGELLVKALQPLLTAVNLINYFPKRFRIACTIVLRKPSKPDYSEPGA